MVRTINVKQFQSLPFGNFDPVPFGHVRWALLTFWILKLTVRERKRCWFLVCRLPLLLFVSVSVPQSISNVSAFISGIGISKQMIIKKIVICELLFSKVSFEVETKDYQLSFSPCDCNLCCRNDSSSFGIKF